MDSNIHISRGSVLGTVEGITATMALHSGLPMEKLWASAGDSAKLDIWWKEGVTALETALKRWLKAGSGPHDLLAAGDDCALTLEGSDRWNVRLTGVLTNRMQEYLVYRVTAGWLRDMPETADAAARYVTAGEEALSAVLRLLAEQRLTVQDSARAADDDAHRVPEPVACASGRHADDDDLCGASAGSGQASARTADTTVCPRPYVERLRLNWMCNPLKERR